jgi:hypothetical protein
MRRVGMDFFFLLNHGKTRFFSTKDSKNHSLIPEIREIRFHGGGCVERCRHLDP